MATSRTALELGTHSIDRVRGKRQVNGSIRITWSVRLPTADGAGETREFSTQRSTIGKARSAAKRRAADELAQAEAQIAAARGVHHVDDLDVAEYVEQRVLPAIANSGHSPATIRRYTDVINLAIGRCNSKRHGEHTHALAGRTIGEITDAKRGALHTLKDCIEEIAALHGRETARQTKNALNNYLYGQLLFDGYDNPFDSVAFTRRINLGDFKVIERGESGVSLTEEEYEAVLAYLLALDPADGVAAPTRGPATLADRVRARQSAVALTLLQMATGLRITEARHVKRQELDLTTDPATVHVSHPKAVRGTDGIVRAVPRDVLVLDHRVTDHLAALSGDPGDYVGGAPMDRSAIWDASNCTKHLRTLYDELAAATGVTALEDHLSHIWRATINSRLIRAGVPDAARAAQLGHGTKVNEKHYTDRARLLDLAGAAATKRPRPRAVAVTG